MRTLIEVAVVLMAAAVLFAAAADVGTQGSGATAERALRLAQGNVTEQEVEV